VGQAIFMADAHVERRLTAILRKPGGKIVKTRYTMKLAIIASFGLGTLAAKALHAQATPPAYVVTIFDTNGIVNTNYPSLDPATFQPFGGRYIVHFGRAVTFDGQPRNQVVIIAFDSIENAQAWCASQAYENV
jgi:uncharacterized protein (DUF1330 family)